MIGDSTTENLANCPSGIGRLITIGEFLAASVNSIGACASICASASRFSRNVPFEGNKLLPSAKVETVADSVCQRPSGEILSFCTEESRAGFARSDRKPLAAFVTNRSSRRRRAPRAIRPNPSTITRAVRPGDCDSCFVKDCFDLSFIWGILPILMHTPVHQDNRGVTEFLSMGYARNRGKKPLTRHHFVRGRKSFAGKNTTTRPDGQQVISSL